MTMEGVAVALPAKKHNWFTLAALALFLAFTASVLDTCAGVLDPGKPFRVVRGQAAAVSGDLNVAPEVYTAFDELEPAEIEQILRYEVSSVDLSLTFASLKGRLWIGALAANTQAEPGEYTLRVYSPDNPDWEHEPQHLVRIFADQASLKANLPSLSERRLGVKPVLLTLALLPLGLAALFLSFVRSGREEAALQARGLGPIYKLARRKTDWELIVGLGMDHGVNPGDHMAVLDKKGRKVAGFNAVQVGRESCHGTLERGANIRPGYFVVREQPGPDETGQET